MLHTKVRENRPARSGEEIFEWFLPYMGVAAIGHMTQISLSNFRPHYPGMLHIKFHFDWPSGFREEDL